MERVLLASAVCVLVVVNEGNHLFCTFIPVKIYDYIWFMHIGIQRQTEPESKKKSGPNRSTTVAGSSNQQMESLSCRSSNQIEYI